MSAPNKLNLKTLETLIREELALINEGAFSQQLAQAKTREKVDPSDVEPSDKKKPEDKKSDNDNASKEKKSAGEKEAGPIPLFTGKPGEDLSSKFFSGIKSRVGKIDKAKLQGIVKSIMKDLSAQLRANGLKVQESQNIYYPLLTEIELQEKKKFKQKKASTAKRQKKRAQANKRKKNKAQSKQPTAKGKPEPKKEPEAEPKKKLLQELPFEEEAKAYFEKEYKERHAKGVTQPLLVTTEFLGDVPAYVALEKGVVDKIKDPKKKNRVEVVSKQCSQDAECAKQYKQVRRMNAEYSKKFAAGGAATQKGVRTGGRVKPQKGVLNVAQAIGGKLKSAGVDQKTITALIVKMGKPFFQKLFKQRGIEGIKIKEAIDRQAGVLVEEVVRNLLKENQTSLRSVKISIRRNKQWQQY